MNDFAEKNVDSSVPLGYIHSLQSLGTVDGPGIRFVVFLRGCNLRCGCCHNPDTWECSGGIVYTPEQIVEKVIRYKEYFGQDGGITVSGGEPLLQADFVRTLFTICHQQGINTCLDTSGSILNDSIKAMLEKTDRILLDIKYTTDEQYHEYVGCSIKSPLSFLAYAEERHIPVTLRQVIIPTLNDTDENICLLAQIAAAHSCVDKVELLSFRKICQVKYDTLGIPFRFADFPEPDPQTMAQLKAQLRSLLPSDTVCVT